MHGRPLYPDLCGEPQCVNVWDVGKTGSLGLHEGLHALILATAGSTINVHMIMPEDSRAHAAKHPNHGVIWHVVERRMPWGHVTACRQTGEMEASGTDGAQRVQ